MKIKYTVIFSVFLAITGCQNSSLKQNLDEEQKIYIHETTKNYGGLVELYKNRLKHADTESTRYKLAQTYYLLNDFKSAKRALDPMVNTITNDYALVLYGRIESKLGNAQNALKYLDKAIMYNAQNGEAYNLKGIVLIKLQRYDAARYEFTKARDMFYDENKVVNNLAMLSILNKEYNDAYNQLNILYNKGYRNQALLHNLLYTLVKLNHTQLARKFIVEHNLSKSPTILVQELRQIEPINAIKFNEIVPEQENKQKQYGFEKVTEKAQLTQFVDPKPADPKAIVTPRPVLTQQKTKQPAPLQSQQQLSQSQPQQQAIMMVRSGEHSGFSRIVFETSQKLANGNYALKTISPTQFEIAINNAALPSGGVDYVIKKIAISNRDFIKVTGNLTADNHLVLQIQTKNASKLKSFAAGENTKLKAHRFAIDFYPNN